MNESNLVDQVIINWCQIQCLLSDRRLSTERQTTVQHSQSLTGLLFRTFFADYRGIKYIRCMSETKLS